MPGIVGYTKKFIILKKDYCTIAGLAPKGHGKLEIRGLKGSLNISIEGAELNETYDVKLVWRNSAFSLGKVYSDKSGKTREDINFNLMDLEAKGFTLDKLNGLVLIRDSEVLLGGYMAKEDDSIEVFSRDIRRKAKSPKNPVEDKSNHEDLSLEYKHLSDEPVIRKSKDVNKLTGDGLAEGRIDFDKLKDEEPLTNEYLIEKEGFDKEIIQQYEEVFEGKFDPEADFVVEDYKPEFEPVADLSLKEEYIALEDEPCLNISDLEGDKDIGLRSEVQADEVSEPDYIPLDEGVPNYEQLNTETEDLLLTDESSEPQYITLDEEEAKEEFIVNDLPRESIPNKEEVKKYLESNQEIVKINNMDYEYNRRVIQKNQTTDYVLNILRYFSLVDPFRQNLEGYRWWRIDFQDEAKGFLPYFSYLVGGEGKHRRTSATTARELMNLYNHYLFGLYSQGDDVKYYVYAVPGGFYKDEHPHGGTTGFNTWFSGNDTIGYWLLYIDPLTGKVIFPVNPMNPVD